MVATSHPRRDADRSLTNAPPHGADDDFVELERSLAAIATSAREALERCDGLGITVQVGHELVFGHSNAFTRTVDRVQYGLMEGPCLLAQGTGSQVRSDRIGTGEQRWPRFTQRAATTGLRSVVSAPLLAGDGTIGSLNLYGATAGCFSGLGPSAVTLVADGVERALRSPLLLAQAQANARWFAGAVQDRADVDRAVGVLMARYGLAAAEAQVLIQQLAREDEVTETVAAWTVIDQDGA